MRQQIPPAATHRPPQRRPGCLGGLDDMTSSAADVIDAIDKIAGCGAIRNAVVRVAILRPHQPHAALLVITEQGLDEGGEFVQADAGAEGAQGVEGLEGLKRHVSSR